MIIKINGQHEIFLNTDQPAFILQASNIVCLRCYKKINKCELNLHMVKCYAKNNTRGIEIFIDIHCKDNFPDCLGKASYFPRIIKNKKVYYLHKAAEIIPATETDGNIDGKITREEIIDSNDLIALNEDEINTFLVHYKLDLSKI